VDSAVGRAVDSAGYSYFAGSFWVGYAAWADYFNEVCGVAIDRHYLDAAESMGFYWTLDGVCFASERPSEINLDANGRLHSDSGMSIIYGGSGWGLHHWHGIAVPAAWIKDRASLTPKIALTEANSDRRRAAIEMLGWDAIIPALNGKIIDADADPFRGTLYDVRLPDREGPARFLKARCGTGVDHFLPVHPDCKTVIEAQAFMAGKDPKGFTFPTTRT